MWRLSESRDASQNLRAARRALKRLPEASRGAWNLATDSGTFQRLTESSNTAWTLEAAHGIFERAAECRNGPQSLRRGVGRLCGALDRSVSRRRFRDALEGSVNGWKRLQKAATLGGAWEGSAGCRRAL